MMWISSTRKYLDFCEEFVCVRTEKTDWVSRTTFKGYGTVNLTLECTDTTWTNPNWTIGQIYTDREVKCAPVSLPVKPYQMTAVA